jgi:hypothetical protein
MTMLRRCSLTSLPLLAALLLAGRAGADAGPKLPRRAVYISPGLAFGGTYSFDLSTRPMLGGEVSAFYWHDGPYVGLFVEGLYDWSRSAARITVGPELGWGFVGLDGGYLADFSAGGPHHGGSVRLYFSLGVVGLFVRYGAVRDAPDFVDFGIFLKAPMTVYREERWPRPVPRPPRDRGPDSRPVLEPR